MHKNDFIVFCDRQSDKHGKKQPNPVVQGFYFQGDVNQLGLGWTDLNLSKRLKQQQAHHDAAQALIGDEKFDMDNEDHWGVERRESWFLKCYKCGYEVAVRHEKLYPALSRMRDMDISRIGLVALQEGLKLSS